MRKITLSFLILTAAVVFVFLFSGCMASADANANLADGGGWYPPYFEPNGNTDEFNVINEQPFISASEKPDSYFSLGINTASYSVIRRSINSNASIYKDQVLIEEMLNYFKFDYPVPADGEILSLSGSISDCPWNGEAHLLTVGIKTEAVEMGNITSNLVFLIDTSGSMSSSDRLPLVQEAFALLTENLNLNDRVSVVTYASSAGVALDGAMGYEKKKITGVIEDLMAGGSTAGAGGIQKAYELAAKYEIAGGNNRVILATDGDFNVGISSQYELEKFISQKRDTGIYLTVLGVGMGNQKNNKMETLANCGNGNFFFLDSISEARKVLIEEAGGTLKTVAKDAKAKISFNSDYVDTYRQLGYENRQLTEADWNDVNKDAGELGAGRCITAVYEIILKPGAEAAVGSLVTASVQFKVPATDESRTISLPVSLASAVPIHDYDIDFISSVVESALVMRNSIYKNDAYIGSVISRLQALQQAGRLSDEYKTEFLTLMVKYRDNS